MRSKKPSLFQQAQKEIKRLQKATKRAEKRGYVFDLPFGRTRTGKEKTRFTAKEVEKLKSLHLKDLYKYSKYGSEKSGYISGEEARKSEAQWQAKIASYARWEKYREKQRRIERIEQERFLRDLYGDRENESRKQTETRPYVSSTIINNCMERSKWRCNDAFYNMFLSVVNEAMNVDINATAEAFQEMKNGGVIYDLQRHYKEDDLWVDYVKFVEYLEPILNAPMNEYKNTIDAENEDDEDSNIGFSLDRDSLIAEVYPHI